MMDVLILGHAPRQQMAARIAALSWRPDVECYYFGCIGQRGSGHHMRGRGVGIFDRERLIISALGGIDGGSLCWNGPPPGKHSYASERDETEGLALLTRRGGWTAIAFWDRSGDQRPASNSAFIARGDLTFEQVVRAARHQWPQVWARFTFDVVEVDRSGKVVTG